MAQTAIQFLEGWREAYVYAEPRALEQLDETVTECSRRREGRHFRQ